MERKIFKYYIVQYYPNIFSREFVNIGILCGNDDNFKSLFLSNKYIEMINCNYLNQKKKVIKSLILNIQNEILGIENIDRIDNLSLYFNNFKFSQKELIATSDNIDVVVKDLFFQYIGYKFVREEKKDKRIIIREKIINEIDLNFKKNFDYSNKDDNFDLVLKNKGTSKIFKTIIGSLFNEHDISRATSAYINSYNSKNVMLYSYFNSENELAKSNVKAIKVLSFLENKIEMNPYNFNEKKINKSLEKLLSS